MRDLEYWRNLGRQHALERGHTLLFGPGQEDKHACNVAYLIAYYTARGQLDGAKHLYDKPMGTFWGFTSDEGDTFKEAYDAGWKQGHSAPERIGIPSAAMRPALRLILAAAVLFALLAGAWWFAFSPYLPRYEELPTL